MHILIITSWYKNAQNPIAASFVEEQARMLQKKGHRVSILHAYINGTIKETLKGVKEVYSEENDSGIFTMRLGTNVYIPKMRIASYHRLCRKSLSVINNYIKKYGKPDLVHSHAMFMGGIVAKYVEKRLQIPYFHTEHTSGFIFDLSQYTNFDVWLTKNVIESSNKSFFVSEFQLKRMREICHIVSNNLYVVHNVVPNLFFDKQLTEKNKNFTFIIIGNLIKRKNVELVVSAWGKYVINYPNDKLIIVGDGPLWNIITQQIEQNDLLKSISLLHRKSRTEIADLLQKCHVLISASEIETFGMTVAEALAVGTPVISTNSGGVSDIMTNGTGIMVNTITSESIHISMLKIRKEYYMYDRIALRDYARSKFSENAIYECLKNLYSNKK